MSDVASSVTYAEAGLPLVTLKQEDMLWSYRSSTFQQHKQRCIVLVTCQLQSDSTAGARAREFTDRCVRLASSTILPVLAMLSQASLDTTRSRMTALTAGYLTAGLPTGCY